MPDRIRASIAKIIHAEPDDIALTAGASAGFAAVAAGIDWKKDDEVIVAQGEFPAHFATWLPYEKAGKLTVKVIAPVGTLHQLPTITSRNQTRERESYQPAWCDLIMARGSTRNALRMHATRLARYFCSMPASVLARLPIDVGATGADFLVSSGYKWTAWPVRHGIFLGAARLERAASGWAGLLAVARRRGQFSWPAARCIARACRSA